MSAPGTTPGPWHFRLGDIRVEGDDGDDRVIAGIGKSVGMSSYPYEPIKQHKPEGIANAHLIAAAPDLYAALERIASLTPHAANALDARDLHLTVKAVADTALARARGETA